MAKEIKAIKCPNCGSVNKTEIKPDFYKCNSCQTEYFLDDNDVNINYNHNYNQPNSSVDHTKTLKTIGIIVGCIFAFFFLIIVVTSIFSSSKKSNNVYTTSTYQAKEEEKEDKSFSASRYSSISFLQPNNAQPVVLMLENRRYNSHTLDGKNGTYITFYNPLKKELMAEEKMSNESISSSDFKFKTFSDGNIYIVNNKTSLLKLDKETLKTEDVGKKFFEANTELQIGVATIEFVYENNGDGLILLTNDGKKRYYYPLIQKLYTEKEYYNASHGFESLLPNAKNKTLHTFTSESSEYPEERIQLIKVNYKDNGSGPKDTRFNLRWWKDYGRSGIFTGGEPYTKVLISKYGIQSSRILNFKDITPDRLYFSPSVLLDDGKNLIIQFRADANTKSNFKIQQVNTQTGAPEWTSTIENGDNFDDLIKYKDGFLGVKNRGEIILLDDKGNIKSAYKLD